MFDRPFSLSIPPGTVHGQVFRMELDPEQLGLPESERTTKQILWVTVSVGESQKFVVNESDLETNLELSPTLALLGGSTVVKTPTRNIRMNVE